MRCVQCDTGSELATQPPTRNRTPIPELLCSATQQGDSTYHHRQNQSASCCRQLRRQRCCERSQVRRIAGLVSAVLLTTARFQPPPLSFVFVLECVEEAETPKPVSVLLLATPRMYMTTSGATVPSTFTPQTEPCTLVMFSTTTASRHSTCRANCVPRFGRTKTWVTNRGAPHMISSLHTRQVAREVGAVLKL